MYYKGSIWVVLEIRVPVIRGSLKGIYRASVHFHEVGGFRIDAVPFLLEECLLRAYGFGWRI